MQYGCIGEKLGHSFSKEIHGKIADYEYELKELKREEVASFITAKNYKALNVTIPYKEVVIPHLDEIDEAARKIGAVNTIVNKEGRLYGYNTDFYGMMALLSYIGVSPENKKVLILGTGGTSRTAYALSEYLKAREIIKVSRSEKDGAVSYETAYRKHHDAEIIINTTPSGMFPNSEDSPIMLDSFTKLEGVIDAIYNPLRSNLITDALKRGIKASGGLYMLVAQAVKASEYFLDTKYPDTLLDAVYKDILSEKENIVLVGMPGAGKTTIGKILAEKLGKTFTDSDDEIKKSGKTPDEIIKSRGEAAFRDVEAETIKKLSDKNGFVIATGGGAVLREENIKRLKRNGKIVFLDRDLSDILPTPDRPLSQNRELLKKRYDERLPIYTSVSDIKVKIGNDANENAENIIKMLRG